jgi:hypothetical protein
MYIYYIQIYNLVQESVTVAVQVGGKVSLVLIHVCKCIYIYIQIYCLVQESVTVAVQVSGKVSLV